MAMGQGPPTFQQALQAQNNFQLGAATGPSPVAPPPTMGPPPGPVPFMPQQNLPAPSDELSKNWSDLSDPSIGWMQKIPITMSVLGNLLQMPQQLATQAMTGGQYSVPGNIPSVRNAFSMGGVIDPSVSGMLANLVLDPLNLVFGAGAATEAARGAMGATEINDLLKGADRNMKFLDVTENAKNLIGADRLSMELLKQKAGVVNLPVSLAQSTTGFQFDLSTVKDPQLLSHLMDAGVDQTGFYNSEGISKVSQLKQDLWNQNPALKSYMQDENISMGDLGKVTPITDVKGYTYAFDQVPPNQRDGVIQSLQDAYLRVKPDLTEYTTPIPESGLDEDGVKLTSERMRLVQSLLNRPEDTTPVVRAGYQIARDTSEGYQVARDMFANPNTGLFGQYITDVKGGSPLSNAIHLAMDGVEKSEWSDDSLQAVRQYGAADFRDKVAALQDGIRKFAVAAKVELETPGPSDMIRKNLARLTSFAQDGHDALVPDPLWDGLRGLVPDRDKYDIIDSLNYLMNSTLKQSHYNQGAAAISGLMDRAGVDSASLEGKYLNTFVNMWKGVPRREDLWLNEVLTAPQDGKSIIDKMITSVANSYLSTDTMSAVERAGQNQALFSEAGRKFRQSVYAGMLGFGVDSAMRSVPQLLNDVVEHGLGKTLQSMGAYLSNPELRKTLNDTGIIERSESVMTNMLEDQMLNKKSTVMDWAYHPMNIVDNFLRGTSFINNFKDELTAGTTIAQAIRNAENGVRKTQFGFSMFDMSPFLTDSPTKKLFLQFANYPLRQANLMLQWVKQPDAMLRNKLVRFLVNTGATIAYGRKSGIDMSNVMGVGFGFSQYPPFVNLEPDGVLPRNIDFISQAPLVKATSDLGNLAKNFLTYAMTGTAGIGQTDPSESPSTGWKSFLSLLRYGGGMAIHPLIQKNFGTYAADQVAGSLTLLTGRYAQKLASNWMENKALGDPYFRSKMASDPYLNTVAEALGVRIDPGVDFADRMMRGLGFNSTRDSDRHEFMTFLNTFEQRFMEANKSLNEAALTGGDTSALRAEWQSRMQNWFGGPFKRWGIPDYVILNAIRASPHVYTARNIMMQTMPSDIRKVQGLPPGIRATMLPEMLPEVNQ